MDKAVVYSADKDKSIGLNEIINEKSFKENRKAFKNNII